MCNDQVIVFNNKINKFMQIAEITSNNKIEIIPKLNKLGVELMLYNIYLGEYKYACIHVFVRCNFCNLLKRPLDFRSPYLVQFFRVFQKRVINKAELLIELGAVRREKLG